MAELLRYDHINIRYGQSLVIEDVDFNLASGEILGIVGESGSGKSTLLKAGMGLLGKEGQLCRGKILYDGKDLGQCSEREMQKIRGRELGMVFQMAGSSFCPIRTLGVQMQEAVRAHKRISKAEFMDEALDLLNKFGFDKPNRILESYPFELSGGMQQRVGIVAAMLLHPRVLLADEPTSALDVSVQKQVVEQFLMIREKFGTSILLVSHNIGVIRAMADEILVLHQGKTVDYGKKDDILAQPTSEYTEKLLEAVPRFRR